MNIYARIGKINNSKNSLQQVETLNKLRYSRASNFMKAIK